MKSAVVMMAVASASASKWGADKVGLNVKKICARKKKKTFELETLSSREEFTKKSTHNLTHSPSQSFLFF